MRIAQNNICIDPATTQQRAQAVTCAALVARVALLEIGVIDRAKKIADAYGMSSNDRNVGDSPSESHV